MGSWGAAGAQPASIHQPVSVEEVVRFEGASDPGDQAILFALVAGCTHRGYYSAAYGVAAAKDDIAVLLALPKRNP